MRAGVVACVVCCRDTLTAARRRRRRSSASAGQFALFVRVRLITLLGGATPLRRLGESFGVEAGSTPDGLHSPEILRERPWSYGHRGAEDLTRRKVQQPSPTVAVWDEERTVFCGITQSVDPLESETDKTSSLSHEAEFLTNRR